MCHSSSLSLHREACGKMPRKAKSTLGAPRLSLTLRFGSKSTTKHTDNRRLGENTDDRGEVLKHLGQLG